MKHRLPLVFALLKVISGLLLAGYGTYELQRDEYLYLDYGRHLAWGYIEVAPGQVPAVVEVQVLVAL
jgi:hypothetical protein